MWTMDELVERVSQALAAEYSGAPNGRVRDLPDGRAIRWYTTTGLVDRPAGLRGRTALYAPRHLLQLVALKRLQAQGLTLAEIQAELAGASDEALTTVARVPEELLVVDGPAPSQHDSPVRARFWAAQPTAAQSMADLDIPCAADAIETAPVAVAARSHRPTATAVGALALGGGAILVLPHPPDPSDYAAITAAAAPLLDLLERRGLLTTDGRTS
jgi:DNA-binding transcriptional MerR regulator